MKYLKKFSNDFGKLALILFCLFMAFEFFTKREVITLIIGSLVSAGVTTLYDYLMDKRNNR